VKETYHLQRLERKAFLETLPAEKWEELGHIDPVFRGVLIASYLKGCSMEALTEQFKTYELGRWETNLYRERALAMSVLGLFKASRIRVAEERRAHMLERAQIAWAIERSNSLTTREAEMARLCLIYPLSKVAELYQTTVPDVTVAITRLLRNRTTGLPRVTERRELFLQILAGTRENLKIQTEERILRLIHEGYTIQQTAKILGIGWGPVSGVVGEVRQELASSTSTAQAFRTLYDKALKRHRGHLVVTFVNSGLFPLWQLLRRDYPSIAPRERRYLGARIRGELIKTAAQRLGLSPFVGRVIDIAFLGELFTYKDKKNNSVEQPPEVLPLPPYTEAQEREISILKALGYWEVG